MAAATEAAGHLAAHITINSRCTVIHKYKTQIHKQTNTNRQIQTEIHGSRLALHISRSIQCIMVDCSSRSSLHVSNIYHDQLTGCALCSVHCAIHVSFSMSCELWLVNTLSRPVEKESKNHFENISLKIQMRTLPNTKYICDTVKSTAAICRRTCHCLCGVTLP